MRGSADMMKDEVKVINAATILLGESKLIPEVTNEALYYRAKAYTNHQADNNVMEDVQQLAKDTSNIHSSAAKTHIADILYKEGKYIEADI